jgi:hypothetical protein
VVNGHAYIFGGSTTDQDGAPAAGNEMHIIRISGKFETVYDYKCVPAIPAIEGGNVPPPRKHHSAAVYGDQILIFGGVNEDGQVWSFDTQSLTWSAREPSDLRSCQVSMNQGAIVLEDRFIVHGSAFSAVSHLQETWSFDLNTNTWSHFASLRTDSEQTFSKPALVGRTICSISMSRDPKCPDDQALWVHYLYLHENQQPSEWQSIILPVDQFQGPLIYQGSPLVPVSTGMGRQYLLFQAGRASSSNEHAEPVQDASDETGLWVLQIPSDDKSLAKLKDWVRDKFGRSSRTNQWAEIELKSGWGKSKETINHPGPRTQSLIAGVDDRTVILWCGCYPGVADGQGDGWMVGLDV